MENKVTPNLNHTKHPKTASSHNSRKTYSGEKKSTGKKRTTGPDTNEKKRINKHLEEEE
jgi:hypothetical protein